MTSYPLTTFDATVVILIKASDSDGDLNQNDRYDRIKEALQAYSRDIEHTYTEDEAGDGGKYYDLATVISKWVTDWSQIIKVEYPAATIASDEEPTVLENEDWEIYRGGDNVQYLRFKNATPAATEYFRLTYTAPYVFASDPLAVDIPSEHFYAICAKAACLCCRAISAKYSRLSDGFLGVDSGAHTSKAQEFRNRADDYCKQYSLALGLPVDATGAEGSVAAGAQFANIDTRPGYPTGRRYVFHRNR
jgi:hypothetical protein